MARTAPSLGPKKTASTTTQTSSAQAYSNTGTQETVKLTFELPKQLHKQLKLRAMQDDTTMREIIEQLLTEYLD